VLFVCFLVACYVPPSVHYTETSAETYNLSAKELALLTEKVTQGDGSAAARVAAYYALTRDDMETSLKWTKAAARLGDEGSIAYLKSKGSSFTEGDEPSAEPPASLAEPEESR